MNNWLLLTLPAAALLWWLFTRWETRYNYRRIEADGAKNSLGFWFHFRRFCLRAAVAGVLAGGGAYPAGRLFWLGFGGQVAGFAGWFLFYFTLALNRLRGKAEYYVSASSTTAWLDKKLWARAVRAYPAYAGDSDYLHQERVAYAASELRQLLRAGLVVGLGVYMGAVVGLIWALA